MTLHSSFRSPLFARIRSFCLCRSQRLLLVCPERFKTEKHCQRALRSSQGLVPCSREDCRGGVPRQRCAQKFSPLLRWSSSTSAGCLKLQWSQMCIFLFFSSSLSSRLLSLFTCLSLYLSFHLQPSLLLSLFSSLSLSSHVSMSTSSLRSFFLSFPSQLSFSFLKLSLQSSLCLTL